MNREGLQDEWILLFNYIKFTVQNIYMLRMKMMMI